MSAGSLVDGLALAATLKADREGAAARAGLTAELAQALGARLVALRTNAGRERERALGAIVAALRPPVVPGHVALPPRAAALLATEVPRHVGAAWLAAAPLPRRGFRATPALRATLRRIATSCPDVDAALAARDRHEGRAVMRHLLRGEGGGLDPTLARALADALAADRDRAPHAVDDGDGDPAIRARFAAFATAALAVGAAASLAAALGGMARGARGEGADRWARAGRECDALLPRAAGAERACRG